MKLSKLLLFSLTLVLTIPAAPQNAASNLAASAPTAVPPLIPYSGVINSTSQSTTSSITFLIYDDETGGQPLFTETQSLAVDSTRHFKAQIGSTLSNGIPIDLFASGEARWLAVEIAGEPAQPRVLLASVPYALKAADAATLGGLPASAFVLASTKSFTAAALTADVNPASGTAVTTNGGFAGYIPVFTGSSTIANSIIFQNANGIGINAPPFAALDVSGRTIFRGTMVVSRNGNATSSAGVGSLPLQFFANGWNSTINGPVQPVMQLQAEPTGNNTAAPGATLNLLYSNGVTTEAETGLYFNANGTIHFAPSQTFPGGGGSGTITGVTAGTALTGGGTTGTVTLNLDTTKVPQLGTANIFVGNQSVTGSVTANDSSPAPNAAGVVGNENSTTGVVSGVTGNAKSTTTYSAGVIGNETAATGFVFGVLGNASSSTTFAAGVNGYETAATGWVFGVSGQAASSGTYSAGVAGNETAKTGLVSGVGGSAVSTTNGAAGTGGYESALTGQVYGVTGGTPSTTNGAAGVNGHEDSATGAVFGVNGYTGSTTGGAAGVNGYEGAATGYVFGVSGATASSTINAAGVIGNENAKTGQVYGVSGGTSSAGNFAAGVSGYEGAATGIVYGMIGDAISTTDKSTGVYGNEEATTGLVSGVFGAAASTTTNAAGVDGLEYATTGLVFGVTGGVSSTTNGAAGVSGFEGAATGAVFGVSGGTNSTTNGAAGVNGLDGAATGVVYGVNGGTNSTTNGAAAVNGYEGATTGTVFGVQGNTQSSAGAGVNGIASSTSGSANGVFGQAASPAGSGVFGVNNSTSGGIGVNGVGTSYGVSGGAGPNGVGVQGNSPNVAVAGFNQTCPLSVCTPTAGTAGLFVTGAGGFVLQGMTGTANFASINQVFSVDSSGNGFFNGNLNVTGNVSKGGGSFKIDHPLDPANKYLSHSFVESPDMMNVYNGNITTDSHGRATVVLPEYFEALNRDFRYQLTVIGEFAQAIVAKEIDKNHFVIRTSKPGVKVSWQVTGIRQDAYANTNRIPTEEEKPAEERGYYLHPEVFGQPAEKSVAAAHGKAPSTLAQLSGAAR